MHLVLANPEDERRKNFILFEANFLAVLKRELSQKQKRLVFKSIFVHLLTYGHNASLRNAIFLQKFKEVAVLDKARNTAIREFLNFFATFSD